MGTWRRTSCKFDPASPTGVSSKGLSGGALREANTHARALDLGVHQYGASFLVSTPAEVVLRRLLALVLAQKMGNFKLASHLEELPGDSALAELPDSIMTDLVSRLKTEAKLETFMK